MRREERKIFRKKENRMMFKKTKFLKLNNYAITLIVLLLAFFLIMSVYAVPVNAESSYRYDVVVNQNVNVKGGYSKPFTPIKYTLYADSADMPLPNGVTGKNFDFILIGDSSKSFPINFTEPGEYSYTLLQHKPQSGLGFSHDGSIYRVYISVYSSKLGLSAKTKILREGDKYKPNGINFVNDFKPPSESIAKVNTGDDSYTFCYLFAIFISMLFLMLFASKNMQNQKQNV